MYRVKWLGHSTFQIDTSTGVRIVIDPWIRDNPACPVTLESITDVHLILVTHGHYDHFADVIELALQTGATVVASPDLVWYMDTKGVAREVQGIGLDLGGTAHLHGLTITMVNATHTCELYGDEWRASKQVLPGGGSCGYIIGIEGSSDHRIYFAGDTDVFRDMKTIRDLFRPTISFLPVGDKYTMGIAGAALSAQWLQSSVMIPMHYNTNPQLAQDTAELVNGIHERAPETDVVIIKPGETYLYEAKT